MAFKACSRRLHNVFNLSSPKNSTFWTRHRHTWKSVQALARQPRGLSSFHRLITANFFFLTVACTSFWILKVCREQQPYHGGYLFSVARHEKHANMQQAAWGQISTKHKSARTRQTSTHGIARSVTISGSQSEFLWRPTSCRSYYFHNFSSLD